MEAGSLKAEASQPQPFLQLFGASVILGAARVLDNLTLSIDVGEHAAILGPNGAGKSTFMRLLTLQQYPLMDREGQPPIRLFGRERWNVFELRSQMGIVSADLHDRFVHGNSNGVVNALDAVASGFFATHGVFAHQRVTAAMRAQALEALDRVGAAALATRTLDTLSTGEVRRVLIARALVHTPNVLVLDEPTRGLDLVARHAFMERVRDVARQGTTILLVTHYVEEIIPEIDRVVLLERGRIAFDGSKREVLTGPRLSQIFAGALVVHEAAGYFHVRVEGTANP
ncbi:MAG TPA: ATP-binding cassette domain-containing protein [Vicinamibacterales bacterium]|nr:ATP-binding cassette domain-containing protein [Vicinamibacterales bacterium]